jgi:hypothetical protein
VHRVPHFRQHAVHHLVAIVQRELLGPVQVAEIGGKRGMVLWKIGEVECRVSQTTPPPSSASSMK